MYKDSDEVSFVTCVCYFCMSVADVMIKVTVLFQCVASMTRRIFKPIACASQVPFTESSDVKESGQRQVEKHVAELGLPWTSFR